MSKRIMGKTLDEFYDGVNMIVLYKDDTALLGKRTKRGKMSDVGMLVNSDDFVSMDFALPSDQDEDFRGLMNFINAHSFEGGRYLTPFDIWDKYGESDYESVL